MSECCKDCRSAEEQPRSFHWPEKERIEVDPEALVISECFEALLRLHSPKDRKRVVRYLFERFDAYESGDPS